MKIFAQYNPNTGKISREYVMEMSKHWHRLQSLKVSFESGVNTAAIAALARGCPHLTSIDWSARTCAISDDSMLEIGMSGVGPY